MAEFMACTCEAKVLDIAKEYPYMFMYKSKNHFEGDYHYSWSQWVSDNTYDVTMTLRSKYPFYYTVATSGSMEKCVLMGYFAPNSSDRSMIQSIEYSAVTKNKYSGDTDWNSREAWFKAMIATGVRSTEIDFTDGELVIGEGVNAELLGVPTHEGLATVSFSKANILVGNQDRDYTFYNDVFPGAEVFTKTQYAETSASYTPKNYVAEASETDYSSTTTDTYEVVLNNSPTFNSISAWRTYCQNMEV